MGKSDDGPAWFNRIGIDRTCRIVGMCRGMITLTRTDDGEHTLWIYDQPIMRGTADVVRPAYDRYLMLDDHRNDY